MGDKGAKFINQDIQQYPKLISSRYLILLAISNMSSYYKIDMRTVIGHLLLGLKNLHYWYQNIIYNAMLIASFYALHPTW